MIPFANNSALLRCAVAVLYAVPRLLNWAIWTALGWLFYDSLAKFNDQPLLWTPLALVHLHWLWCAVLRPLITGAEYSGPDWYWLGTLRTFTTFATYLVVMVLHTRIGGSGMFHDCLVAVLSCFIAAFFSLKVEAAEMRVGRGEHLLPHWVRAFFD